jgi:hypothetical protein
LRPFFHILRHGRSSPPWPLLPEFRLPGSVTFHTALIPGFGGPPRRGHQNRSTRSCSWLKISRSSSAISRSKNGNVLAQLARRARPQIRRSFDAWAWQARQDASRGRSHDRTGGRLLVATSTLALASWMRFTNAAAAKRHSPTGGAKMAVATQNCTLAFRNHAGSDFPLQPGMDPLLTPRWCQMNGEATSGAPSPWSTHCRFARL